jgi:DNA polymerase III delta prime subunit
MSVRKLDPARYILTTSAGLTPKQKNDIVTLFHPYIKATADILGRNDLNNLLSSYPEVEKDHFKLWLSSVPVLEKILHSKVVNQSSFEKEKIKETIRVYVENDSYYEAIRIIKAKKYVIVSGTPGIGKTTLARILAYHFLANGFEEFVFLSDSINDAYEAWQENVKQVFLFDDFLGRNFLDKQLSNNEEQRIVRFIEKVNKSTDKVLIMTTREYILAQAKIRYDIFDSPSLEFAKCVIDLSIYTKLVRAKILYNHLFFSDLDRAHVADIIKDKAYSKIIAHLNYSPRVIETITNPDVWMSIDASDFSAKFLGFLDYPESIWKHSFENQISRFSQCVLANLLTAGAPITLGDLKRLIQHFAKNNPVKYGFSYSDLDFKRSIKELENSFLCTRKDSFKGFVVDYVNPSVQDFLVNYFKEMPDYLEDILQSAIYFNQFFTVLINKEAAEMKNKIILDKTLTDIIVRRLLLNFDDLNSSVIIRGNYNSQEFRWLEREFSVYTKLNELRHSFNLAEYPALEKLIISKFSAGIRPVHLQDEDMRYYVELFDAYRQYCSYEPEDIIENYATNVHYLYQVADLERFGSVIHEVYEDFVENNEEFRSRITDMMEEEAGSVDEESMQEMLDEIISAGNALGIDYKKVYNELQERLEAYENTPEEEYDWENERFRSLDQPRNENEVIDDMFGNLLNDPGR